MLTTTTPRGTRQTWYVCERCGEPLVATGREIGRRNYCYVCGHSQWVRDRSAFVPVEVVSVTAFAAVFLLAMGMVFSSESLVGCGTGTLAGCLVTLRFWRVG